MQIRNNGTVLVLSEVQTNQEGRYSCIATNKVGRAEADIFLQVTGDKLTQVKKQKHLQDYFELKKTSNALLLLVSSTINCSNKRNKS